MQTLALIFFSSFVIALSGALMPGPMLTVTIANASNRGFWVGPLIVLGHGLLEVLLILLVLAGLGPFLTRPDVIGLVGLAGAVVLWWLGAGMIRNAAGYRLGMETREGASSGNSVVYGILSSLSNPYWTVWWATIGLGYLAAAWKLGAVGILVFFTGHILADLAWYSAVSLAVSRGRRFMGDRPYQTLIRVCGLFLIFFGAWFFYFGWQSFA